MYRKLSMYKQEALAQALSNALDKPLDYMRSRVLDMPDEQKIIYLNHPRIQVELNRLGYFDFIGEDK